MPQRVDPIDSRRHQELPVTKRTAKTYTPSTSGPSGNGESATSVAPASGRSTRVRRVFAFGGALAIAAIAATALPSCDSTAKFSLPDRKFIDLQVVTTFPAHIAADGTLTRVCGVPLENEVELAANGVELDLNFVSTELKKPLCATDRDQSIKEGELIELYRVKTDGEKPTVGINNFKVSVGCLEPRGPINTAGSCSTGIKGEGLTPSSVEYKRLAPRCSPSKEESRMNVALLMDHSGSVSGFVDKDTFKEDNGAKLNAADPLVPSDKQNSRIQAAERLIDSLNDRDRLIGYYFNEKLGVSVAADDNLSCVGGPKNGKTCISDKDCNCGSLAGCGCFTGGAPDGDTFESMSLSDQQQKAFGSNAGSRQYLRAALESKVKYSGEGRSNLWDAIDTAYAHLKAQKVGGPRHIVVVTDGPETCMNSEEFVYVGSDQKCRIPCLSANQSFIGLRKRMHTDEYPVVLHFLHFQSIGYKQPSAKMQELACRTGGTYQFVNTQEMNLSDAQAISGALIRAIKRIRYTLSGSWRVGLALNPIADPNLVKTGKMFSGDGFIKFENSNFPSLDTVYASSTSWKFGVESGNEDRRVLFRKGCKTAADCGGTDECGQNHCTEDGLCVSTNAPDKLPCGGGNGQVCCKGVCSKDCTDACK